MSITARQFQRRSSPQQSLIPLLREHAGGKAKFVHSQSVIEPDQEFITQHDHGVPHRIYILLYRLEAKRWTQRERKRITDELRNEITRLSELIQNNEELIKNK